MFDFTVPPNRIAQEPSPQRDGSRLLVLPRHDGPVEHRQFRDLPEYLRAGDLLVLNDTRVVKARLIGRRESTGGNWQGLVLGQRPGGLWEMIAKSGFRPREGEAVVLEPGGLRLIFAARTGANYLARPDSDESADVLLERHGHTPLPPYIRSGRAADADAERYQTVFAREPGSVAAPTAGLHFTPELLTQLGNRGVESARVTLHVGVGTFMPIKCDDPADHVMHSETCRVSAETAEAVLACKERGGRVVAVGTTATRALESACAANDGRVREWQGDTRLFIRPPYTFGAVDGLVTNFHLPKTTLLYLVAALAGVERLRDAYSAALAGEYRFFSYGDAMLVI